MSDLADSLAVMTVPFEPAASPVVAAIGAARESLAQAATGRVWHLSDAEVLAALAEGHAAVAQAHAAWLRMVAEADRRNL